MNSFEQNEERIKADVNAVIQSAASGQPDLEKLKEAGSDILNTAASLLSNSGIDQLTGGGAAAQTAGGGAATQTAGGGAAAHTAGDIVKKLRDGLGLDSHALDGLKQAAEELKNKL
jgi:hypothetical protein